MNLFDQELKKAAEALAPYQAEELSIGKPWPLVGKPSFIMARETVLELGGYPHKSTCLIGATTNSELVSSDRIVCYGNPELFQKKSRHISFGMMITLNIQEPETSELYESLKGLQYVFYRMHMENIMLRSSMQQLQVNLRFGKAAMKANVSLERIGAALIAAYKENPLVNHVQVAFLMGDELPYQAISSCAEKTTEIILALNTLVDQQELSCGTCSLREICDEVEGLRQMHMNLQ